MNCSLTIIRLSLLSMIGVAAAQAAAPTIDTPSAGMGADSSYEQPIIVSTGETKIRSNEKRLIRLLDIESAVDLFGHIGFADGEFVMDFAWGAEIDAETKRAAAGEGDDFRSAHVTTLLALMRCAEHTNRFAMRIETYTGKPARERRESMEIS